MPNVTTYYEVPHASWNDFPGSQFSYKPPLGTNRVIYKFKFYIGNEDSNLGYGLRFYVGGTEVTAARNQVDVRTHHGYTDDFLFVLNIGETDDIANGKLLSWNTL